LQKKIEVKNLAFHEPRERNSTGLTRDDGPEKPRAYPFRSYILSALFPALLFALVMFTLLTALL
jgi:hypothetical protein